MEKLEEAKQLLADLDRKIEERKLQLEEEDKRMAVALVSGRGEASIPVMPKDPDVEMVEFINNKLTGTGLRIQ